MPTYDGFISYSHARDRPIATALQSAIQRLGKPWYRRRAMRVFRDDTSLSAAPQLWPAIEQALSQSRFLILLASPQAATSQWVNQEVAYWLQYKGAGTLLLALTEGDLFWNTEKRSFDQKAPLPPVLAGQFLGEPRWVELRGFRDGVSARDPKFMNAAAEFAAAMRGIAKEDLLSQELHEQRRALRLATSATIGLIALLGLATTLGTLAQIQRGRAERTLAAATDTANDLVMDVAVKVRNRLGIPVHLVREILTRARGLLDRLSSSGEISPDLRSGIGRALRELAQTMLIQGDTSAALEAAERSRDITLGLVAENPDKEQWQTELALSHNRVGESLSRANRRGEALRSFQLAFDLRKSLADRMPADTERQRDLAVSYERIGDELVAIGEIEEALQNYQNSFDIRSALALDEPTNRKWARDLSISHEKIGDIYVRMDDYDMALKSYESSLDIRQSLAADDEADAELQRDIAVSYAKFGDVEVRRDRRGEAIDAYGKSLTIRQKLAAADAGNVQWQIDLIAILLKLVEAESDPATRYALAVECARRLETEGKLPPAIKDWLQRLQIHAKH